MYEVLKNLIIMLKTTGARRSAGLGNSWRCGPASMAGREFRTVPHSRASTVQRAPQPWRFGLCLRLVARPPACGLRNRLTMLLQCFLLLVALVNLAIADVKFLSPAAGETLQGGSTITVEWEDSGDAPELSQLTSYQLFLCAGGNEEGTFVSAAGSSHASGELTG